MNTLNLYVKPETVALLDKVAEFHGLPSKSAVVAFLAKKEARTIEKESAKKEKQS